MHLSLIVAVSENGVIGRGGTLPWHLSADLRRFKQLTMGHVIIMGRRTWESIARVLPGRTMIVVSRQTDYRVPLDDVRVANNLAAAIDLAKETGDQEAFVIGGAELYREALLFADQLHVTRVAAKIEGDTYFPEIDWNEWNCKSSESHPADANNDYPYTFHFYERYTRVAHAS